MDILVTAFEPFGGFSENMSAKVLELLPCDGIKKLLLPTSYRRSAGELIKYLSGNPVRAVVLLGQAPRGELNLERVAINLADASLPDNDGVTLTDEALEPDGPAAYFSTLPLKKMLSLAECRISNTAGTYVCNSLMYRALHMLDGTDIPCGFIHIPQEGDPAYFAAGLNKLLACL